MHYLIFIETTVLLAILYKIYTSIKVMHSGEISVIGNLGLDRHLNKHTPSWIIYDNFLYGILEER